MKEDVKHACFYYKKWAPKFGFGHYHATIVVLDKEDKGKVWGKSTFNHEEEWVVMEVVPDGILPRAQVEALMLHELSHGIISLACSSDAAEEMVCNRISRLANEKHNLHLNQWNQWDGNKVWSAAERKPKAPPGPSGASKRGEAVSPRQLAELGLTPKHISQIMTGKATGSPRLLDLIAWGMGCRWHVELVAEAESA